MDYGDLTTTGRDEKGKFTEKNIWSYVRKNYNGGRPRIYENAEHLIAKGMEYFEWADETQKGKYAEAELRLYLGFYSRTTYYDYKHNKDPQFANAIYILEAIMEGDTEKRLMWAGSTQGAIFKLKNKHGWKDEVEQKQTVTNVKVEVVPSEAPLSNSEKDVNV